MGGWVSYLWWGGDPDRPDALSGLSRRDVHLVRRSWAPLYKNQHENGTEIFKRLFRANPQILKHFRMLNGVEEKDYGSNFQFKAHVINLMTAFNTLFQVLDQPDVAAAMMEKVGETHNKRKIPKAHFEDLKAVLVKLLKEVGCDASSLAAWGRTVAFMYGSIYPQLAHEHQHIS